MVPEDHLSLSELQSARDRETASDTPPPPPSDAWMVHVTPLSPRRLLDFSLATRRRRDRNPCHTIALVSRLVCDGALFRAFL